MVFLCLVVSLLAASAGGAPQSKKNRDWLLLLPVQFKTEMNEDEMKPVRLLIRGQTVNDWEAKGIPTISPVQMSLTEKDLGLKLDDLEGWDKGVIDKLIEHWKPRYVALIVVDQLESREGAISTPPGTPPPPGGVLITDAKVSGWLWDVKTNNFIFEKQEGKAQLKVGRPGPSQEQVNTQNLKAALEASRNVFKEFLKKLPTPRKVGIDGG